MASIFLMIGRFFSNFSFSKVGNMSHPKSSNNPWAVIKPFSLELLVDQVISSATPMPLSPGDGFRRIFESLAGKIIVEVSLCT